MQKLYLICLLLIIGPLTSMTQSCYQSFDTQAQVDSFPIKHPGCKVLDGELTIGEMVSNINALLGLEEIKGSITIISNPLLQNINGLSSIKTAYNVFIIENKNLKDCKGLAALTETQYIKISRNNSLVALQDIMPNLQSAEDISIYENEKLSRISDFKSLKKAFVINIYNNKNLKSIKGFYNLKTVAGIQISESPVLDSLSGFTVLSSITGGLTLDAPVKHLSGFDSTKKVNVFKIVFSKLKQIDGFQKLDSCSFLNLEYNELLENLDNLSNITHITGLRLFECQKLSSLAAFRNVLSCSDIFIGNMSGLLTLNAFHEIKEINSILIGSCDKIKKINAFEKLQKIRDDVNISYCDIETFNEFPALLFSYKLRIGPMAALKKIKFNNPNLRMYYLTIEGNDNLEDISDIDNLTLSTTETTLEIFYNPKLSLCSYNTICEFLKTPGIRANISNNKLGCNSIEEVVSTCITDTDDITDEKVGLVIPTCIYDALRIRQAELIDNLQIYTLQGLPIMSMRGNDVNKIDVGHIQSGLYLIKVTYKNKEIKVQKVVKI
jgi:hypothetical protein